MTQKLVRVRQHKPTCLACLVGAKLDACDCGAIDSAGLPIPVVNTSEHDSLKMLISRYFAAQAAWNGLTGRGAISDTEIEAIRIEWIDAQSALRAVVR